MNNYKFADLVVYMRAKDDDFINITDYDVKCPRQEIFHFPKIPENSDFAVGLFPLLDSRITNAEFSDLMKIAGISDKSFMNRFKGAFGDESDNIGLLAILCAKKIADYDRGIVAIDNDSNKISCYRRSSKRNENGKTENSKVLVFQKDFL